MSQSNKARASSLSISSMSSRFSTSSSREFSPHASPRRGLLSTSSPPLSPSLSVGHDYVQKEAPIRYYRTPCLSQKAALSLLLILSGTLLLIHSFIDDSRRAAEAAKQVALEQAHLPMSPSAIIFVDDQGKKKWTVWIPPTSPFPLRPWEYAEICAQTEQLQLNFNGGTSLLGKKKGYYHKDKNFMDVSIATSTRSPPFQHVAVRNPPAQISGSSPNDEKVCEKSITFVMETEDVGMGNSLLAIWLTYGLAKKEQRAFFLNDDKWPYGKYTDYFKAPPDTDCRPPPINELVPCPRTAQHLVISAATFAFVFGPSFQTEFVDKSKDAEFQHHKIHHLMNQGYKDLFHLADTDEAIYAQNRTRGELYASVKNDGGMTIGVHVRHGDVHPWEKEFHNDYLPLTRYMNEVREILITTYEHDDEPPHHSRARRISKSQNKIKAHAGLGLATSRSRENGPFEETVEAGLARRHAPAGFEASQVFLASDDPLVYSAPEMSRLVRAQDRLVLASKAVLDEMTGHQSKGPVDHVHGWEGGFFAAQFLSLGSNAKRIPLPARERLVGRDTQSETTRRLNAALQQARTAMAPNSQNRNIDSEPKPAALQLRRIVGRAYLLDLAVIGQADAIVCGVSSAACRVLGVMAGWDKIKSKGWRNVDGKFGWQGLIVR